MLAVAPRLVVPRLGIGRSVLYGSLLFAAGQLATAFAPTPAAFVLAIFVSAVGCACIPALVAIIAEQGGPGERGARPARGACPCSLADNTTHFQYTFSTERSAQPQQQRHTYARLPASSIAPAEAPPRACTGALLGGLGSLTELCGALGNPLYSRLFAYFISDAAPLKLPGAHFIAAAIFLLMACVSSLSFSRTI